MAAIYGAIISFNQIRSYLHVYLIIIMILWEGKYTYAITCEGHEGGVEIIRNSVKA